MALARKRIPWYHEPTVLVAFTIILVLMLRGTYFSFIKKNRASTELQKYEEEKYLLTKKRDELRSNVDDLLTPRGKEEVAREKFNATLPGEKVIRVTE